MSLPWEKRAVLEPGVAVAIRLFVTPQRLAERGYARRNEMQLKKS